MVGASRHFRPARHPSTATLHNGLDMRRRLVKEALGAFADCTIQHSLLFHDPASDHDGRDVGNCYLQHDSSDRIHYWSQSGCARVDLRTRSAAFPTSREPQPSPSPNPRASPGVW